MKYAKALIDVIELEAEDVVLTSGCPAECRWEVDPYACPAECRWEVDPYKP